MSDTELLQHLKEGDERALRLIFDRFWDKLLAYATHRLGSTEEAEEAVQDLFIKLWTIREKLDIRFSLGTYLSKAITNTVYDRLDKLHRASRKHQDLLASSTALITEETELLIFEKELRQEIETAVNHLPEKCRIVFMKSRFEGKSNAEIAEELNLSQRTVETHISNALKSVRKNLSGGAFLLLSIGTISKF
jgi:RNA polymerase sigma-70 factor (family 1)